MTAMTKRDMLRPPGSIHPKSTYVLGLDLNRRGNDETAFVVVERFALTENLFVSYIETNNYKTLTAAIGRTLYLHSIFNFTKIYVDSTGLGSGVCDVLKEKIGHGIVEEVMFTRNSKAEMFYNLKLLLQQKKLFIPDYLTNSETVVKKMYFQFLSIQQEFTGDSEIPKIYHDKGTHDDIVCSLALACIYFNQKRNRKSGYFLSGAINN